MPAEQRSRPLSYAWDITARSDRHAYDRYAESMRDIYDVEGVDGELRTAFHSRTAGSLFDNGSIARGLSAPQTLRRTPALIRASGLDAFSIFVLFAPLTGDVEGADVRAPAGSIHFRDMARPSVSQVGRIDLISLMIPRAAAPLWMRDGALHGLAIGPDNPLARLLIGHLSRLSDVAADLSHDEGAVAIEAVMLITERALGRANRGTPEQVSSIHQTVRERASGYMRRRLLDPRLTVHDIAASTGVSRTTLFRAFAPGGLRRHMLDLRLDRARSALNIVDARRQTVAEIAYAHGFASAAHFGRLYRERFGHAPGEVTVRAREADGAVGEPRSGYQHEMVVDWLRTRNQTLRRDGATPSLRAA